MERYRDDGVDAQGDMKILGLVHGREASGLGSDQKHKVEAPRHQTASRIMSRDFTLTSYSVYAIITRTPNNWS